MDKICGIYKITSPSGKIYIGQSSDIKRRFYCYSVINNCENQIRLKRSLLKYKPENHIFEIIEECSVNLLSERERYWQEHYNVLGEKGLNCKLTSTDTKNALLSDETKIKISKANKGRIISKETRDKMSKSRTGLKKSDCIKVINISNNIIYNSLEEAIKKESIKHSPSYMRAMLLNLKHNFTNLRYLNKKDIPVLEKPKHSRVGTKHSTNSKSKISDKKKGNNCSGKKVVNVITNLIYESAKKAFESQTEIKKYGTFRAMLSGHLKNKTNYKYLEL